MASYRPFHPPPHSTFAPNQNPLQPPATTAAPPLPPPPRGGQIYNHNYQLSGYGGPSLRQPQFNQPYQYQPLPPPPPPPPMYFPSSQYSQQPPPPPASPPPPPPPSQPSPPPPVPPAMPPTVGISRESKNAGVKHDSKPPLPSSGKKPGGVGGKVETEEERRLRKKREYEKQKHDEKMKHHLKDSQNKVLQKTQMLASGSKGHGSISGSQMGDRRSTTLLSGDRIENRLKKPTTFICKMKFRNELPDPSAKMKYLPLPKDPDRYCKYQVTSLEKNWKPQLYVEPDLGIPLDLLDLSVYNPPKGERIPLDPEDEELLRDDDPITPIKNDGIKKKERPTDKGVSWLVKTQYISPISMDSTKQALSEKQARELKESRDRDLLENLNNRDMQIQNIEASFEACKSKPVNKENPELKVKRVLPLFPYFDRYDDQYVVVNFDSAPTGDSEGYSKLSAEDRDEHERRAIMKSYVASTSEAEQPDKILAYMVPSVDELEKNIYDENEDVSYSWIREYHWDVRGDDVDDPNTYLVAFGDSDAKYLPLPTKLMLRKKRARDGKSGQETEHFPAPKSVTVRNRPTVAALELRDEEETDYVPVSKKGRIVKQRDRMDAGPSRLRRMGQDRERDDDDDDDDADNQFSGGEEDEMSD